MESKEINYERTDDLLSVLRLVVEDLRNKSREFSEQNEIDEFNKKLELQINNVESII